MKKIFGKQHRIYRAEREVRYRLEDGTKGMAFADRLKISFEVTYIENGETEKKLDMLLEECIEKMKEIIAEE